MLFYYHYNLIHFYRLKKALPRHLAALSKQGGNGGQGFFSAAGNDDHFLDLDVVDGTADEGGQGEMKEFCCIFEFQFFSFRYSELDDVRFVVRRVVLGFALTFVLFIEPPVVSDSFSVKLQL